MVTTIVFGIALIYSIMYIQLFVMTIYAKSKLENIDLAICLLSCILWSWLWYLCH